ncbi:hypothetical protein J7J47_04725 [Halomonas sp. ISL-60]|uniref:hypothetical protein n=1 Tax=Halomonas sp. ISL-56 TaxID=2819149 RepID=UPI001BE68FF6|nr:hypothetical protein [Halomonas sp. ISL-56]MBT2771538.1 hypothetical protein [Halomonas sp. ISL-60]MBT2801397.1 hypothetical protein [Halomonas sp. ISL-56]
MHSETSNDLSKAGLQIAIQDIKDELFDTPECDYAIAQLLTRWGQAEKAEQLLDEMLMKWGTSHEVLALTRRGYAEMAANSSLDDSIGKSPKTAPATLEVVAA